MADFLVIFILNLLVIELLNYSSILIDQIIFYDYFYNYLFFLLLLNYIFYRKEKFNFNIDIITKYYFFLLKKPNFLLNFIFIVFKKIYTFTFKFKYKFFIDTNKIFFNYYFKKLNLIWRPLFKKFSYFGYYRSNRSKWIK